MTQANVDRAQTSRDLYDAMQPSNAEPDQIQDDKGLE